MCVHQKVQKICIEFIKRFLSKNKFYLFIFFFFSSTLKHSNSKAAAASPSTSSQCSSGINTTSGYSTNDGGGMAMQKKSIGTDFFQNLRIKKLKKTFSVVGASTLIKSPDAGVILSVTPNLSDNDRMTPTKLLTFAPDTKEKTTKRQSYRSRSKSEKKRDSTNINLKYSKCIFFAIII